MKYPSIKSEPGRMASWPTSSAATRTCCPPSKPKSRFRMRPPAASERLSRPSETARVKRLPSLRDIRRRIKGVRSTAQITRAMQMVAASRMRRAQLRAQEARPYAEAVAAMVGEVAQQKTDPPALHPLQRRRPENHVAYVVFTSDRGLAGALNANTLRRVTAELLARSDAPEVVTVGRKGQDFFTRRGHALMATFTGLTDRGQYDDII